MLVFISGGVRSGKSSYGEELAGRMSGGRKVYLATSEPYDSEMEDRIKHHQEQRRGKGFFTIEKSRNIGELEVQIDNGDTILLDCLGNLLANEMFGESKADDLIKKICSDIFKLNDRAGNLIVISNDVFSDGCGYQDSVLEYIDKLAKIHIEIVKAADMAVECVFGNRIYHKDLTGRNDGLS